MERHSLNTCSICFITFNIWGPHKRTCSFCYRPICSRCSMNTAKHPELNLQKRICDACHSDLIKESATAQCKVEVDRLKMELSNLEKRYETEAYTLEKESEDIEEMEIIIEETKEEAFVREREMRLELKQLESDVEIITKDSEEAARRLEVLSLQNIELDIIIENNLQQIEDFGSGSLDACIDKIRAVEREVDELSRGLGKENCRKEDLISESIAMKCKKLKEEIFVIKNERAMIESSILELKEVESIKESSISMLLTTLSNKSTLPDINFTSTLYDDEELIQSQEEEINQLEHKISKRQRKHELENKTCKCEIF